MTSASRPPKKKNANEAVMYRTPIRLWSVVANHDSTLGRG
jgi:hypothetical protein